MVFLATSRGAPSRDQDIRPSVARTYLLSLVALAHRDVLGGAMRVPVLVPGGPTVAPRLCTTR